MALILGKPVVGRLETLQYANDKFNWPDNVIIGIGHKHGFYAWLRAMLTGKKCIYYCIDFYSPEIADNLWDRIFIWGAMQMDKFLVRHVDEIWDISNMINEGRRKFGKYMQWRSRIKIVPLSYPPDYFRYEKAIYNNPVFVGLHPYGIDIMPKDTFCIGGALPLQKMLFLVSNHKIGISVWDRKGNNYYGDPGKTKLYSACGLPVIMTGNTPYAKIIMQTGAGIIIPYDKEALEEAILEIIDNYDYFKENVKKTWEYINADEVFKNIRLLER